MGRAIHAVGTFGGPPPPHSTALNLIAVPLICTAHTPTHTPANAHTDTHSLTHHSLDVPMPWIRDGGVVMTALAFAHV